MAGNVKYQSYVEKQLPQIHITFGAKTAYEECKTLKNEVFSLMSGCNCAKSGELYSEMEKNLCMLSLSKTSQLHSQKTFLWILTLLYDMWLKQYPFHFHSYKGQTFIGENSITMLSYPSQINSVPKAPSLSMPHCQKAFILPQKPYVFIANQLQKRYDMTTKKEIKTPKEKSVNGSQVSKDKKKTNV